MAKLPRTDSEAAGRASRPLPKPTHNLNKRNRRVRRAADANRGPTTRENEKAANAESQGRFLGRHKRSTQDPMP